MCKRRNIITSVFLAMIFVLSCAVPAFAADGTGAETALDFELIYEGHNFDGSSMLPGYDPNEFNVHDLPEDGLVIYDDSDSFEMVDRINGDGSLSYGRVGEDDYAFDPATQCVAVVTLTFGVLYSDMENTDLLSLSMKNGDITAVACGNYASDSGAEPIVYYHFIVILEKAQLADLGIDSVYTVDFTVSFSLVGSRRIQWRDTLVYPSRWNAPVELDFEIIYAGHNWDGSFAAVCPDGELYTDGFFILDDERSAQVLESVNGGNLSYGRVGEERVIDPETECLAVLSVLFRYYPADIENTALSGISLSGGDVRITVTGNYESSLELDSFNTFRFIVVLEKQQLTSLGENSRYYLDFEAIQEENKEHTLEFPVIVRSYDINGDDEVDVKDLTRLMKFIAGEGVYAAWTDVNGDCKVDVKDVTRLMKQLSA